MNTKPPAQIAGVKGIAPKPIELTPARPLVNWGHLCELPPYQMYAIERSGKSPNDLMGWIHDWTRDCETEQARYDDYCQWHAAKGYWPLESPSGATLD